MSSQTADDPEADPIQSPPRGEVGRLFAAALDGDRRAEAALYLTGGFDDTAHRASWALLRADQNPTQLPPPDVIASIDRVLAVLRDHHRSSRT